MLTFIKQKSKMRLNIKLILTTLWISLFFMYPVFCQNNNLKNLKAILIVGHQESITKMAIENMNKIANLFSEKGVVVYKFYDEKADWNQIIKVAKNCNFFIYSGHGSRMGENGNAGGICINSMVSSSELMKTLRLKENALVVFQSVCNGAGSSASDEFDIGIAEAKKRVTYYAYPFFEVGASAYYANNFWNGAYDFLKDFLSGITLKESYLNSKTNWTNVEFEEAFSKDKTKSFSIASVPESQTSTSYTNDNKKIKKTKLPKDYLVAYVGKPGFSIIDMINNKMP